jgi:hypothetical protein
MSSERALCVREAIDPVPVPRRGLSRSRNSVDLRDRALIVPIARTPYRLEVTQTFLEGEGGAAIPLKWIRDWNLAGTLRDAGNRVVTLKNSGVSVG